MNIHNYEAEKGDFRDLVPFWCPEWTWRYKLNQEQLVRIRIRLFSQVILHRILSASPVQKLIIPAGENFEIDLIFEFHLECGIVIEIVF